MPLRWQTTEKSPSLAWQTGGGRFLLLPRRHALSLGGPRWLGSSWQRGIAESGSSQLSTLMIETPGDLASSWKGAHCCGYGPYTCTLIKNLMMTLIFYFYLLKKIRLDFSCESSAKQRIHMKYQALFYGRINIPVNQLLIQARLHWLLTLFRLSAYISLIYITSVHAVPAWSNLPWISPLWHWLIPLGAFRRCVTSSASNQIKAQELAPVSVFSSASREQVVFIIDSVKMHYFVISEKKEV